MEPVAGALDTAGAIAADSKIEVFAAAVLSSDRAVPVIDGGGTPIGVLRRELVLGALFPERQP